MITQSVFESLVSERFDFLRDAMGDSKKLLCGDFCVRYQGDGHFVEVVYDPNRSHELGVLVGQNNESTPPFELGEVLRACGCPEHEVQSIDLVQSDEPEILKIALSKAAELLHRYGAPLFRGDTKQFEHLAAARSRAAADYTASIFLKQVANSAESAWQRKDYSEVVRLLKPHRDHLDAAMARRLRFAEEKN